MLSKLNPVKWCHFQHQLKYFAVVQNKKNKNTCLWYIWILDNFAI